MLNMLTQSCPLDHCLDEAINSEVVRVDLEGVGTTSIEPVHILHVLPIHESRYGLRHDETGFQEKTPADDINSLALSSS